MTEQESTKIQAIAIKLDDEAKGHKPGSILNLSKKVSANTLRLIAWFGIDEAEAQVEKAFTNQPGLARKVARSVIKNYRNGWYTEQTECSECRVGGGLHAASCPTHTREI